MAHWDSIGFVNEENVETIFDRKPTRFDIQRRRKDSLEKYWYVYRSVYNDTMYAKGLAKSDFKSYKESQNMFEYEWRMVSIYAKPTPKKLTYADRLLFVNFALQELDRLKHPRNDYAFWAKYILATLGLKEKV